MDCRVKKEFSVGNPIYRKSVNFFPYVGRQGQAAVEYVLLIILSVAIGTLLVKGLVSRDSNNPGAIIQFWQKISEEIGKD